MNLHVSAAGSADTAMSIMGDEWQSEVRLPMRGTLDTLFECSAATRAILDAVRAQSVELIVEHFAPDRTDPKAPGYAPSELYVRVLLSYVSRIYTLAVDGDLRPSYTLRSYNGIEVASVYLLDVLVASGYTEQQRSNLIDLCDAFDRLNLAQFAGGVATRALLFTAGCLVLQTADVRRAAAYARRLIALRSDCPDAQLLFHMSYKLGKSIGVDIPAEDFHVGDLSDRFCDKPFKTLLTSHRGYGFLCDCLGYLPYSVGNVFGAPSHEELWNSKDAQRVRGSILDGSFKYCNRGTCTLIKSGSLPKKSEITERRLVETIANRDVELPYGPSNVQLSHDPSCNLACPSCRTEIIMVKGSDQGMYEKAREQVVLPMLRNMHGKVTITGGGDPFGSKHYRSIIEALNTHEYPDVQVALLTNGLLFDEAQWQRMARMASMVMSWSISIDAASAETYAVVRRPGDFKRLLKNLELVKRLREAGEIKGLTFNFVVQKANFREMPAFVELAQRFSADLVWFQRLENFGSYSEAESNEFDVAAPHHPLFEEFISIVSHSSMSDMRVLIFSEMWRAKVEVDKPPAVAGRTGKLRATHAFGGIPRLVVDAKQLALPKQRLIKYSLTGRFTKDERIERLRMGAL